MWKSRKVWIGYSRYGNVWIDLQRFNKIYMSLDRVGQIWIGLISWDSLVKCLNKLEKVLIVLD